MSEQRKKLSTIKNNPKSPIPSTVSLMNQWVSMGGEVIRKILLKGGPIVALLLLITYLN
jgi:hypothetical protein